MDGSQFSPIIIGKLMNIGGMLHRLGNRMLLPYELNQQQYSVLFEIARAGKVKQKDMVNRLVLEKAHVSKIVKKLQNMDFITVTPSDDDKRSSWLAPTQKGRKITRECSKAFKKWNRQWAGSMDEQQLISIIENLALLQAAFRKQILEDSLFQKGGS
jgi:DNA-binding MarR family transcriptional regulator